MTRKLQWWDWIIIIFLLLLTVIPDPTDTLDAGLPIVEPTLAYAYYRWRIRGKLI